MRKFVLAAAVAFIASPVIAQQLPRGEVTGGPARDLIPQQGVGVPHDTIRGDQTHGRVAPDESREILGSGDQAGGPAADRVPQTGAVGMPRDTIVGDQIHGRVAPDQSREILGSGDQAGGPAGQMVPQTGTVGAAPAARDPAATGTVPTQRVMPQQ